MAGGARPDPVRPGRRPARPSRTRRSSCTPSRRRSVASSRSRWVDQEQDDRQASRRVQGSRCGTSSSSAVVAERPREHRRGRSTCCRTRTSSSRSSCRSRRRTCPSASRRGRRSTGSSGRTSTAERLEDRTARGAPWLGRRQQAARHRRREHRAKRPGRIPRRPSAVLPAPPSTSGRLVDRPGRQRPQGAPDLPALSGALIAGPIAGVIGDRVVAASGVRQRSRDRGRFDPSTKWIADGERRGPVWRRLIPCRTCAGLELTDDSEP